jgi:hypothetical protein
VNIFTIENLYKFVLIPEIMGLDDLTHNMYKKFANSVGVLTLSALIAATSLTGCRQNSSRNPGNNQVILNTQAPGISEELQYSWPIWKPEDLEINKQHGPAAVYNSTLNLRPMFYNGRMPLEYKSSQSASGMGRGLNRYYSFNFGDFSNYFIYDDLASLEGIVAVDNANHMVAEAKVTYIPVENGFAKIQMEEFHYADGLLVYHCMSQVDNGTGAKISESDRSGRKIKDYFFILPVGLNDPY